MAKKTDVSVAEAKQHLSELLGRVAYGHETVTISKRGRPMAKLVPIDTADTSQLADVEGWLKDDDSFFADIDAIVSSREQHTPRAYGPPAPRNRRKKKPR